ncbi:MAG: DUF2149 domain-containing protein [Victivallaceae bacterium]|jgi:hypothetical protein
MKNNRYLRDAALDEDINPLASLANLFDVAMVFAVALMVAFAVRMKMTEFLTGQDATFIKNAGKKDMEIIVKKNNKVTRYKASESTGNGKGRRVGVAYQLENGDVIYVPEGTENK